MICVFEPPFLAAVSRQTFDALHKLTASPPRSDSVVLIDIDEASLAKYGQWPWSRNVLARLTQQLWNSGVRVVAYDMAFAEPDRLSPRHAEAFWRELFGTPVTLNGIPSNRLDFDNEFAAALKQGHAILGCYADWGTHRSTAGTEQNYRAHYYELGRPERAFLWQAGEVIRPIVPLTRAATGLGIINTTPDPDSIVRRTPLVCSLGNDTLYPSLALECLRLYLGEDAYGIVYDDEGVQGVMHVQVGDHTIPTDAHGRIVLNYRSDRFPRVSAFDVVDGTAPAVVLSNRIAIVGTSAAGLRDLKATPIYPELPGFEVQATALENMLSNDVLREPRWMFTVSLVSMTVLGILLALLISRMGAIISFGVTLLSSGAVALCSLWLLEHTQLVMLPAETVLCFAAIYGAVTLANYWLEERERMRVRSMFGTMVSGEVLRFMEENPDSFSLTGRKETATVFFSDIVGFTSIAETMDPDQVSRFMNLYLTPVTEAIMRHDGFVDKFFGDAVVAVWGIPFDVEDHALRACLAALEQQRIIETLRPAFEREFGHVLRVRMGLNTGTVIAGNMGSERRFEYTVLGDPVNLAARFESANRLYGTSIIIGEETRSLVRTRLATRLLDKVIVRGESKPVLAYELLGKHEDIGADRLALFKLYEEALELHWDRKWDEAEARLEDIARAGASDAPSSMLRHRIDRYRHEPPEADWEGEYALRQK
jgi:adenylate cyclase